MPLPISRWHWNLVRKDAGVALATLACAKFGYGSAKAEVLYHFMNDVVVQFSRTANQYFEYTFQAKSSLAHASKEAVESYFALFHLLLCIAIEDKDVVEDANSRLNQFPNGQDFQNPLSRFGPLPSCSPHQRL